MPVIPAKEGVSKAIREADFAGSPRRRRLRRYAARPTDSRPGHPDRRDPANRPRLRAKRPTIGRKRRERRAPVAATALPRLCASTCSENSSPAPASPRRLNRPSPCFRRPAHDAPARFRRRAVPAQLAAPARRRRAPPGPGPQQLPRRAPVRVLVLDVTELPLRVHAPLPRAPLPGLAPVRARQPDVAPERGAGHRFPRL